MYGVLRCWETVNRLFTTMVTTDASRRDWSRASASQPRARASSLHVPEPRARASTSLYSICGAPKRRAWSFVRWCARNFGRRWHRVRCKAASCLVSCLQACGRRSVLRWLAVANAHHDLSSRPSSVRHLETVRRRKRPTCSLLQFATCVLRSNASAIRTVHSWVRGHATGPRGPPTATMPSNI